MRVFFCIERGDTARGSHTCESSEEEVGVLACEKTTAGKGRESVSGEIYKKSLQKIADNTVVYLKQKTDHAAADHLHALCNCFLRLSGR